MLAAALPAAARAQDTLPPADRQLVRDILRELIEINTTDSAGHTPEAARAMAQRLVAAGFPAADVQVLIGPDARHGNLVARYRGSGKGGRPVLVMAHLDGVPARREDWSVEPFGFTEREGWFYGRGSTDNKAGAAMLVADFIRLKRERFVPDRDLVLMLEGDEETAGSCVQWLIERHRDLLDAEVALHTDAGGGVLRNGKPLSFTVHASEKGDASHLPVGARKG